MTTTTHHSPLRIDRALSLVEAAMLIGCSESGLRNMIRAGRGPRVQRVGRRITVRTAALEMWLADQNDRVVAVGGEPTDG